MGDVYHRKLLGSPSLIVPSQYAVLVEAGGQQGEGEGAKLDTVPTVEFILELHPAGKKGNTSINHWDHFDNVLLVSDSGPYRSTVILPV